ncbi:MAG TPA: hypothetical protein VK453_19555 [Micromonosporaceae bacterium]|nr:hypothetical protein [Micromonosporaceae bacterium]
MNTQQKRTYHVVVTRENDHWLASASDAPGAHTFAASLPKLDGEIREAIALAEDLDIGAESSLDLVYEYHSGDPALDAVTAELRAERARLNEAERALTERTAAAARVLVERLSVRDAATLLAVSPQRISQVAPRRAS